MNKMFEPGDEVTYSGTTGTVTATYWYNKPVNPSVEGAPRQALYVEWDTGPARHAFISANEVEPIEPALVDTLPDDIKTWADIAGRLAIDPYLTRYLSDGHVVQCIFDTVGKGTEGYDMDALIEQVAALRARRRDDLEAKFPLVDKLPDDIQTWEDIVDTVDPLGNIPDADLANPGIYSDTELAQWVLINRHGHTTNGDYQAIGEQIAALRPKPEDTIPELLARLEESINRALQGRHDA